ncbi:MAG: hypothetical protein ACRDJC_17385 [Thermomicrobiales bacterium]
MCAHMNASNMITLAEIRRGEMLQQAEQYRLAKQAANLNTGRGPRGVALSDALMALRGRINAMRQRPDLTKPIDLAPAPSETT